MEPNTLACSLSRVRIACASAAALSLAAVAPQDPCQVRFGEPLLATHEPYFELWAGGEVECVDLDRDGELDLVLAAGKAVHVFLGQGAGRFEIARRFATGVSVSSLELADFDLDGDPDVAAGSAETGRVYLLRGEPTTLLGLPQPTPVVAPVGALASGDFDGDGALDLVIASATAGHRRVLWNDGSASFASSTALPAGWNFRGLHAVDFNGDGSCDVAYPGGAGVLVVLGSPQRVFTQSASLTAGTNSIVSGDFNQDGALDLATCWSVGSIVRTFAGDGTGAFAAALDTSTAFVPGALFPALGVTDHDGDGHLDLLHSSVDTNAGVIVLRGDGTRQFTLGPRLTHAPTMSAIWRDLDGDGRGDLACVSRGNVLLALDRGQGLVPPIKLNGTTRDTLAMDALDLDQDGWMDLVASSVEATYHGYLGRLTTFVNLGGGAFAAPAYEFEYTVMPRFTRYRDLDGDADPDRIYADTDGRVRVALGSVGTSFAPAVQRSIATELAAIEVEDLDGDGRHDLVGACARPRQVAFLRGDGQGGFGPAAMLTIAIVPDSMALGDVDGDADLDLVLGSARDTAMLVVLNDGAGSFTAAAAHATGSPLALSAVADWDADGLADVLATRAYPWGNSEGLWVVPSRGSGFLGVPVAIDADPTFAAKFADLDGNGRRDFVRAVGHEALEVRWAGSDGVFGEPQWHWAPYDPFAFDCADLDRDGRPDLAAASRLGQSAVVLLQDSRLPGFYCEPSPSAAGCAARSTVDGCAQLSGNEPFWIRAREVDAGTFGGLLYGFGRASAPFFGATLCVESPVRRLPIQSTGGASPCSGTLASDFNPHIRSGVDPALVPGVQVHAQTWFLDVAATNRIGLSDAVEFTVLP